MARPTPTPLPSRPGGGSNLAGAPRPETRPAPVPGANRPDIGNIVNRPGSGNIVNRPGSGDIVNRPGGDNNGIVNRPGGGNIVNRPGGDNSTVVNRPGGGSVINRPGGDDNSVVNRPGGGNVINRPGGDIGSGNVINRPGGNIGSGNVNIGSGNTTVNRPININNQPNINIGNRPNINLGNQGNFNAGAWNNWRGGYGNWSGGHGNWGGGYGYWHGGSWRPPYYNLHADWHHGCWHGWVQPAAWFAAGTAFGWLTSGGPSTTIVYSNPYYAPPPDPGVFMGYDYSQPIPVPPPPVVVPAPVDVPINVEVNVTGMPGGPQSLPPEMPYYPPEGQPVPPEGMLPTPTPNPDERSYQPPPQGGPQGSPPGETEPADEVMPDGPPLPSPEQKAAQEEATRIFDEARAAFGEGKYADAQKLDEQAIQKLPGDATLHEFRALTLFAQGKYQEAAGTLYAVLAAGPGWDWETLRSFYPDESVYAKQLQALEEAQKQNPNQGNLSLLLAYHYLAKGSLDRAVAQLENAVRAEPKDQLSAQLLKVLKQPRADGQPGGGQAELK